MLRVVRSSLPQWHLLQPARTPGRKPKVRLGGPGSQVLLFNLGSLRGNGSLCSAARRAVLFGRHVR